MRRVTGGCVAVVVACMAAAPASALAPVTVTARDAAPFGSTPPTLVGATQVVRVRERSQYPHTKIRFKVYPDTSGARALNSRCQGRFYTARARSDGNGVVTIRLDPARRLCRGVIYQAEALIGSGDVPDKIAHMCVRGRETPTSSSCQDSISR